jgi:[ribosomal protein S18]-alanine N-acetyltransferase
MNLSVSSATPFYFDAIKKIDSQRVDPWSCAALDEQLKTGVNYIVTDEQSRCLGFALYQRVSDESTLLLIVVDKEFHHQGVGAHLLSQSIAQLKQYDLSSCFLEVRESNDVAQRMYKREGFVEIAKRKNYYRSIKKSADSKETAVVMKKNM